MIDSVDLVLLGLAALLAGFIDAVAGGGGLVQVPALFTALPLQTPATLFGTNKLSSIFGTGSAAWRYSRQVEVCWRVALPAALSAAVFSFAGAAAVAWLPRETVRPLVFGLLLFVIAYTLARPSLGQRAVPLVSGNHERLGAVVLGAVLGFYDGFFGPGTGSFLIFLLVRFFSLDFLRASVVAKIVNLATNAAALAYFIPHGQVLWVVGLVMAVANITGAQIGSRLAIQHGNGFVRWVFIATALVLLAKFGWDTFRPVI
ncbi:MAG: TSUP family transporter [Rhodocyclaceae bacterium]|nr:TSUP family transporter [Rhodocyclaceae bacterium]MBP7080895.1 TSUP family transporter [Rhodocyclaceae bacterium]